MFLACLENDGGTSMHCEDFLYTALLLELNLQNRIEIDINQGTLKVVNKKSLNCTYLDNALLFLSNKAYMEDFETIRGNTKYLPFSEVINWLGTWATNRWTIQNMQNKENVLGDIKDIVGESLVARGLVKKEQRKRLFLFMKTYYPPINPGVNETIKVKIRDLAFSAERLLDSEALIFSYMYGRAHSVLPGDWSYYYYFFSSLTMDEKIISGRESDIESKLSNYPLSYYLFKCLGTVMKVNDLNSPSAR